MKKHISWIVKLSILSLFPLALFFSGPIFQMINPVSVQATPVTVNLAPVAAYNIPPEVIRGKPVHIAVPAHNVSLPVIDGSYNERSGEWTLTDNKAQFATNSSIANNQGGNTFIYGHDIPQVFKHLANLKENDLAHVVTENGYTLTYKYRSAIIVPPTDTSVFTYRGAPILTLQTCSGIWSESRRLMTFDFVEAQKL